jgi:hypothetical protein
MFHQHSQRTVSTEQLVQQTAHHCNIMMAYQNSYQERQAQNLLTKFQRAIASRQSSPLVMHCLTMARLFDVLLVPTLAQLGSTYPFSTNAKFMAIARTIQDHPEDKMVITSSFTAVLKLLAEFLDVPTIMYTGSMTNRDRQQALNRFHDRSDHVLLLSKEAGGTGLNLMGVNRMIIFEPHPTYAMDNQVKSRVLRLGQTQKVEFEYYLFPGIDTWLWQSKKRKLALSSVFVPNESHALIDILQCRPTEQQALLQQINSPPTSTMRLVQTERYQRAGFRGKTSGRRYIARPPPKWSRPWIPNKRCKR